MVTSTRQSLIQVSSPGIPFLSAIKDLLHDQ
jgi:hypothetical protein